MRVLIVDDSATLRNVIKRGLNDLHVTDIAEAGDGAEALGLFQQGGFDLILSDWIMAGLDGLEFLKEVRKVDPSIPFLMVTTESERSHVILAIQAGVSDYVVKPFTAESLKSKLDKWVSVRS
jgi:two-component system, chemotaxis family, chemotaxis protein CheY